MDRKDPVMSSKPNPSVIPWDLDSLSVLRQAFRVAVDEDYRSGIKKIEPPAIEVAKQYNISSENNWQSFVLDLPVGRKIYKDLELSTEYAGYLIQFLVKRFQLPIRPEWHRKSFVQRWEMRGHKSKGDPNGS